MQNVQIKTQQKQKYNKFAKTFLQDIGPTGFGHREGEFHVF